MFEIDVITLVMKKGEINKMDMQASG